MLIPIAEVIEPIMLAWGAAIGAALGGASSAFGAAFAAKQARKQREFVEKMRNTAYRATMSDMRKAGLNPILAYRTGPTTAGGAAAATTTPNFGGQVSGGAQAGTEAEKTKGKKQLLELQSAQAIAAASRDNEVAATNEKMQQFIHQQTATEVNRTARENAAARMSQDQLSASDTRRKFDESWAGKKAVQINRARGAAQGALNAATTARGLTK